MANQRGRRRPGFLIVAILLGLVAALAMLEGLCRLLPMGDPPAFWPSPLEYQQIPDPLLKHERLPGGDWLTCYGSFRPWAVETPKPGDVYRIVVLGGSAAHGLGFSHGGAFPNLLQRLLNVRHADQRVEVVNLSSVGYSSYQIWNVAELTLEQLDPDLLLIYSGNNELLDFQGMLRAYGWSGRRTRLRFWMRDHSAFYRALSRMAAGTLPERRATIDEGTDHGSYVPDADDWRFALTRYERNLRGICDSAAKRNVDVLLSTVQGNAEVCMREDRCFFCDSWTGEQPLIDADWSRDQAFALLVHNRPHEAAPLLQDIEGQDATLLRAMLAAALDDQAEAKRLAQTVADELAADEGYAQSPILWARYLAALHLLGDSQRIAAVYPGLRDFALTPDFPAWSRVYFLYRIGLLAGDDQTWRRESERTLGADSYFLTATPRTNAVVQRVAQSTGAALLIIEPELTGHCGTDHVGYDLLLDYCHFNYRGAWLAAAAFAQSIEQGGWLAPSASPPDYWSTAEQSAQHPWLIGRDYAYLGYWIGVNADLAALVHRLPSIEQREQKVREQVQSGRATDLQRLWELNARAAQDPSRELMIEYQRLHRDDPKLDGAQQSAELCGRWAGEPLIPYHSLDQLLPTP
ncbi:MAG: hypothetical protein P9M14_02070 [Candidatus Alcyoniella australis]|nr:hypothetical protein [Candidatus Alcyoniella australis]